jgi:DNA mismatch endonuclease, patch repair protein
VAPTPLKELPYPTPQSAVVSERMRRNPRSGTRPETDLRSLLHSRGLRFRKDYPLRAGGLLVRPDIVFTRARVAVFVDGCFWHRCPDHGTTPRHNSRYWTAKLERNVERDRQVTTVLRDNDWRVVRIWEHVRSREAADHVIDVLDEVHALPRALRAEAGRYHSGRGTMVSSTG